VTVAEIARNRLITGEPGATGALRASLMKVLGLLGILVGLVVSGGVARGHAIVISATPRAETMVSGDTVAVEIRFNSRIDAARSHLKLFRIDGDAVALPLADAGSDDTLKASARGLTPGRYRLHWQTLSPDGHISQGDIPFGVSPR
jgi:copper resistance protein C